MLAAVILSGGESSRMGTPKALLRYQEKTFLEHLLQSSVHEKIGARRIVLGADAAVIARALTLPPEETVINADWRKGTLSSIHAALKSLPPHTDGILLQLIDHPLVTAQLIHSLIAAFYSSGKKIVVPLCKARRGHPVIFSAALYQELLDAPLDVGARAVVWAHPDEVLEVPTEDQACLQNINDPATFAALQGNSDAQ
jgi:molybdenum cofactor cytidylyltransferase